MHAHSFANMFAFAFAITAPIFVMVILGVILKRVRMIDEPFIATASRLVYNIGLPTLLFISSATTDFGRLADGRVVFAITAMTLLVFIITQMTAGFYTREPRDQGVFVQGAFRGNLVIMGLALCANAYGDYGLALAALPVAVTVILYNLLSVYTLNRSLGPRGGSAFSNVMSGVIRNPLIIAIAFGLLLNALGLGLPNLVRSSAGYLGQMVLPLALICIGGALNLRQLYGRERASLGAVGWKLLLSPLIACVIAILLGVRGEALAVLFLLAASPSATAGFTMVQALNGNAKLAANIVVQSTVISLVTMTLGLWLLQVCRLL